MSSHSRKGQPAHSRRQVLALVGAALSTMPVIAACQPLYGPTASGAHLKDVMASIDIATIPGRVGQRLRNELIFTTTGGGYPAEPKYKLIIIVRESLLNLLVEETGEARGQTFLLQANFKLIDLANQAIVLEGQSTARAAFDRYEQAFANVRAQVDAENRAATQVAEGIRSRLAAFLSKTA